MTLMTPSAAADQSIDDIQDEAVDVANFALIIADTLATMLAPAPQTMELPFPVTP